MMDEIDLSSPVYTAAHIGKLFGVSTQYAQKTVVRTPGFPAARQPMIGKNERIQMNKTYLRDEVLAWYQSNPVELERAE